MSSEFLEHVLDLCAVIVADPQVVQNVVKRTILLLHFLVMAPALIGGPGADEGGHAFENLVHASELFVLKVAVVHFQEPVISLLLEGVPVANKLSWLQRLPSPLLLLGLLFLHLGFVEHVKIAFVII